MKISIKIRTHYDTPQSKPEVNSGEVMTEQDQGYTIEEILEKYARGITLDISQETFYSDTDDFDEIDERSRIHDLTDINEVDERLEARRVRKAKKTKSEASEMELAESQKAKD